VSSEKITDTLSRLSDVSLGSEGAFRSLSEAMGIEEKTMEKKDFLDYEIRSSFWACWISWGWAQKLAGKYFAWKTRIKYKRYEESIFYKKWLVSQK
jgi:hypothetical protein